MAYSVDNYHYSKRDVANTNNGNKLPISELKKMSNSPAIQKRFQEVLGAKAPAFIASVIGAVNGNYKLQKADPTTVLGSAMIAATLNLSVVPTLGQAALVPYKGNCQFQVMVRGLVQLAQRTGLYKTINAGEVYEDEYDGEDLLTGEVSFHRVIGGYRDKGETDKIVGYFAFMETTTGFRKTEYWTKADVWNHGERYSKSFEDGPWATNFDAMAKKTVLKSLLNHYGPMSVDSQLAQAITKDQLVVAKDGSESYEDNAMDGFITGAPEDTEAEDIEPLNDAKTPAESAEGPGAPAVPVNESEAPGEEAQGEFFEDDDWGEPSL